MLHTSKKQIIQCSSFIFAKRWVFGFAESINVVWSCRKKVGQSRVGRSVARFPVTTNYGKPSVKVTWQADPNYNLTEVVYFDFKEGDDYGEYLNRGLSTKSFAMFGSAGEAKDIKINPDEGEISFDFYFNDRISSKRTENTFTITQQYCTIYISSNQD